LHQNSPQHRAEHLLDRLTVVVLVVAVVVHTPHPVHRNQEDT